MKRPSLWIRAVVILAALTAWGPETATAAAPVARDDFAIATDRYLEVVNGQEVYSILIDVLANDEDADGDRLEVVVQGDFGLPPWTVTPTGSVNYLGGGVFELSFGKDALGDATEVTFQYELDGGAGPATVRVGVAGEGPPPEFEARDDVFDDPWACRVLLPVLENDTGLDTLVDFGPPSAGTVEPHPADPNVLVYSGPFDGATFDYTAMSSETGATATATVSVQQGNWIYLKSGIPDLGPIALADCFDRADGTVLNGEQVGFYQGGGAISLPWTSAGLSHLAEAGTLTTSVSGPAVRRKAYLPFYTGDLDGSAYELRSTFHVEPDRAEWVALAFTHGTGSVFSEADLWVRLNANDGTLVLNGRWGGGFQETLATAAPEADGYPFVANGRNHIRLRYDTGPATPQVDVWVNDVRVFSGIEHADVLASIENVGYLVNYGDKVSAPGDIWFDDFELVVGDVEEAVLAPKSGHPTVGLDVEDGGTIDLGALHLGCTSDHSSCVASRETSLWLTNEGSQALEVSHLNFEGSTDWTLVEPAATELTIPAGASAEVRVRVDAQELGSTASYLELSTNDLDAGKLTVHFTAEVFQAPIADFVHYCEGLTCSFDGRGSTGEALNDFSYSWSMDGAVQGQGATREHVFSATGTHTAALVVADASGASHRVERTVTLLPEPAFTAQCVDETRTCEFDAALTGDGVASYEYSFGDGTTAPGLDDPGDVLLSHTYATSGRYEVTLTVQDAEGQEASVTHEVALDPVVDFTATCSAETTSCDFDASLSSPGMVLYEWSFGDGGVGSGLQATRPYATSGIYTVTLTVVDPSGQIDAVAKAVAVPPRAEISVECDIASLTCDFDGTGSSPGVSYSWSFGDGSLVASGASPSHTYAGTGVYTVTLTVTDVSGQTASDSRPVVIAPSADFTFACDGLLCELDASASSPGVSSYAWSFGHGGATGTGAMTSHAFPADGAYQVSLTVTDGSGQAATTARTVSVSDLETLLLILLGRR